MSQLARLHRNQIDYSLIHDFNLTIGVDTIYLMFVKQNQHSSVFFIKNRPQCNYELDYVSY